MADTPASEPAGKTPADFRKAAYDFCERPIGKFDSIPPLTRLKGFNASRSQTITGDTIQRTYLFTFDLKLTGCELPAD